MGGEGTEGRKGKGSFYFFPVWLIAYHRGLVRVAQDGAI